MPRRRFSKKHSISFCHSPRLGARLRYRGSSLLSTEFTRPPRQHYLLRRNRVSQISAGVEGTDEAGAIVMALPRGWLLRGAEGAPAVVFLHRYGGELVPGCSISASS